MSDDIEVGPGFAEAAAKMSSEDTRTVKAAPAEETEVSTSEEEEQVETGDNSEAGEDQSGDDDSGEENGEIDEKSGKNTAKYIRELRKERREDRRRIAELEARITAPQNSGLPTPQNSDTPAFTRDAPDPNDQAKYPLGALDDRYIEDKIDWAAEQKVHAAINGQRQTEMARAAQAAEIARVTELRATVDKISDIGADLFPDFEENVVEAGLAGKYDLTETTFTAAAESEHGAEILYNLAKNTAEATRVAKLSPVQQIKYVLEQEKQIAEKRKARVKPQAGSPPANTPKGRNASNPIRPDTENLDDFRKLFYAKK